jgi:hypothetical protein
MSVLKIKVLGPGCYNCYALEGAVAEALEILMGEEKSIQATLQHIDDPMGNKSIPTLIHAGFGGE